MPALLAPLKLSELKKKARADDSISEDDVDGVDDEDDPKAATIELLVTASKKTNHKGEGETQVVAVVEASAPSAELELEDQ